MYIKWPLPLVESCSCVQPKERAKREGRDPSLEQPPRSRAGQLLRAALRPLVLEIGLKRHWNLKGKRSENNFQVAFQELEELTSNSAIKRIMFRKELSQQLETVATVGSVHPLSLHPGTL